MQNNIKIYNQNPENINQKLNENMVFELADNEAKEVKKIISFEKIHNLRKKLQKWNANYLTSFSKTELTNPQEFIPLLSIYYQRPARFNPESGLILLQKVLKDKNRFLVWFLCVIMLIYDNSKTLIILAESKNLTLEKPIPSKD
ncbi:hypothetical protein ACMC2L_000706 [Campylobacter jejuni]|uniref:hypothetical protein n=1 Tax=Campylobacter TaxID=194 RepID=UPI000AC6F9B9|nr:MULTISPECIES: hypothetical protein [Campylobacter]KAJ9750380.1 hypothetical protein QR359_02765 [Campylobacter jejuni]KAJ9811809.1 hypothetical protein QR374_07205 [Campylobacter jejuni]KAJ9847712.1 hypothetical protein QR413_07450 [Campylobacter jejuni]KAJ9850995.1 hypothetical protein QR410_08875 [Campylobacter jejuni]KAJ9981015.1 hypothetical protein QR529_05090 [Campylobacter jejuni]